MIEALSKVAEVATEVAKSTPEVEIDPDARIEAADVGGETNGSPNVDPDARIPSSESTDIMEKGEESQEDIRGYVDTRQNMINDLNNMTDRITQFLDGDGEYISDSERESIVKLLHDARQELEYPDNLDHDPNPELTSSYNRAMAAYERLRREEGSDYAVNDGGYSEYDGEYYN
jgi:hypothetical protein